MIELFLIILGCHFKPCEIIMLFQLLSRLPRFSYDILFYDRSVLGSPLSVNAEYPNNATMITNTQILA